MKELIQPKILIVCYSYSGNTLALARAIRQRTGGGLTRVFPTQPYPTRFPELLAQVRRELKSRHYPRLLPLCEAPDGYDLIFAGTPNWCGTVAPPLAAYLRQHGGLAGKTVLPFYSHCGGEAGDVAGGIRALCPRAQVGPALAATPDERNLAAALDAWLTACGVLHATAV